MSFGPIPPGIPGDSQVSFSQVNDNSIFYGASNFLDILNVNQLNVDLISPTTLTQIYVTSTARVGGQLYADQVHVNYYFTVGLGGISSGGDLYSNGSTYINVNSNSTLGFYGNSAHQQTPQASTSGYTQNTASNPVYADSTFKGINVTTSAYTIDDVVTALKNYGLLK